MTNAKTLLANKLLKKKGLNPSWLNSEGSLSKDLQHWIADTLTKDNNMPTYPNNPYLTLLILNCCQINYSARNVDKLISSQDCQRLISSVARKHFPAGHSFYQGNEIDNPDTLCAAASTILFFELDRKQGLNNKWMTYGVSQLMGNFCKWIKHRLHDHMKSNKDNKTISMGGTQGHWDDDSRGNHEDAAQAQSSDSNMDEGIDEVLIAESEDQTKQMINEFVLTLPLIAIGQTTYLIEDGDGSWNLFMKLNALNLLQWLMSNPLYCDNTDVFDLLCQYADVTTATKITWKNNLPLLLADLNTSETSQGTKAKDFTLFAFDPSIEDIDVLRSASDIKTQRETLRRRNNNTHAGVYTLCLLACLTIKGKNAIGVKLLESLLEFYHDIAMKIVPAGRWLLTKDMMMSWAKSDASIGKIRGELLNIIAMVRYESNFESLSDTKRANVFKIHRILKSVGHKIAANPSIPVESR